jgi:single-stranded DNA-binding protein
MAEIKFYGFVQPWNRETKEHPAWGMKVAETHGSKDKPETNTRTFHNVKVSQASGIDLTNFPLDTRVYIEGSQKTEKYEVNGETRYTLVVWANSVTVPTSNNTNPSARFAPASVPASWTPVPGNDNEPF